MSQKQAVKIKSHKMKDKGWRMKDEGMIDFMLFGGFADKLTERWTDIYECRVAFANENHITVFNTGVENWTDWSTILWGVVESNYY